MRVGRTGGLRSSGGRRPRASCSLALLLGHRTAAGAAHPRTTRSRRARRRPDAHRAVNGRHFGRGSPREAAIDVLHTVSGLVNSICPAKVSQCWQAAGLAESTHRTKYQSLIGQSITILCVISSEIGAAQSDASTRRHTPTRRSPLTHRRLADIPSLRVSRWGRFQRGGSFRGWELVA